MTEEILGTLYVKFSLFGLLADKSQNMGTLGLALAAKI